MKTLFVLFGLLGLASCATPQPERPNYGGALAELYRNGTPARAPYRGYDNKQSYTCTSTPVYSVHGTGQDKRYYVIRTDVRCD